MRKKTWGIRVLAAGAVVLTAGALAGAMPASASVARSASAALKPPPVTPGPHKHTKIVSALGI